MHVTYLKIKPPRPKNSVSRKTHSVKNYSWVISWRPWKIANDRMSRLSITPAANFSGHLITLRKKNNLFVFWSLFARKHKFWKKQTIKTIVQMQITRIFSLIHRPLMVLEMPFGRKLQKLYVLETQYREVSAAKTIVVTKKQQKSFTLLEHLEKLFMDLERSFSVQKLQTCNKKLTKLQSVPAKKLFSPFFSKTFLSITFAIVLQRGCLQKDVDTPILIYSFGE